MKRPGKARSVSEARRKGLRVPSSAKGAKAPQASRLARAEQEIALMGGQINQLVDLVQSAREIPLTNVAVTGASTLGYSGEAPSRPPYKDRLAKILNGLHELTAIQESHLAYLHPAPSTNGNQGAEVSPSDIGDIIDRIEHLVGRNTSLASEIRSQF